VYDIQEEEAADRRSVPSDAIEVTAKFGSLGGYFFFVLHSSAKNAPGLDKCRPGGYNMYRKRALPISGLLPRLEVQEVTAKFGRLGGYFFFIC
jgi:hypothetical protein